MIVTKRKRLDDQLGSYKRMKRQERIPEKNVDQLLNDMEEFYIHQLEEQRRLFSSFVYDHMVPPDQVLSYVS
jgi:hypothetical protein